MKNYKKYFTLNASPEDVYNALTNSKMLEIWTGEPAIMQPVPNTEFSLWNGAICGMNLKFEENREIVQQWFFGENSEPSVVTIKLHLVKNKTSVEVVQTNIPDEAYTNISEGWTDDYFASLAELFNV